MIDGLLLRFITNVVLSVDSLHIYLSVSKYIWTICTYARADSKKNH